MNKNVWWACIIYNVICVICLTILAIMFNKWWIILFEILFVSFPKTKHEYYRICDKCGKHSEYADSYNTALDKAKAAGWIHYVDGNKDYCPDCQKDI